MANEFPGVWFDTFLSPDVAAPVHRELTFIRSHFPLPDFIRLVDVPCGIGRHAGPLQGLGYQVVGIDRSNRALAVARQQYPSVDFRGMDMLALDSLEESFDGVSCLWQSFGYGTSAENVRVLGGMRSILRSGGRLLMDIYNAHAAAQLPSESQEERADRSVWTKRRWSGSRLRVELRYSDSDLVDVHEWELYSPEGFREIAESLGLEVVMSCAWFDPSIPPSPDHLRMQFLLERPS